VDQATLERLAAAEPSAAKPAVLAPAAPTPEEQAKERQQASAKLKDLLGKPPQGGR
jgi:hypothetical protein